MPGGGEVFSCPEPNCGMSFEEEAALASHRQRHQMRLRIPHSWVDGGALLSEKSPKLYGFTDQTPTPSKLFRMSAIDDDDDDDDDDAHSNPFDQVFQQALSRGGSGVTSSTTSTCGGELNTPVVIWSRSRTNHVSSSEKSKQTRKLKTKTTKANSTEFEIQSSSSSSVIDSVTKITPSSFPSSSSSSSSSSFPFIKLPISPLTPPVFSSSTLPLSTRSPWDADHPYPTTISTIVEHLTSEESLVPDASAETTAPTQACSNDSSDVCSPTKKFLLWEEKSRAAGKRGESSTSRPPILRLPSWNRLFSDAVDTPTIVDIIAEVQEKAATATASASLSENASSTTVSDGFPSKTKLEFLLKSEKDLGPLEVKTVSPSELKTTSTISAPIKTKSTLTCYSSLQSTPLVTSSLSAQSSPNNSAPLSESSLLPAPPPLKPAIIAAPSTSGLANGVGLNLPLAPVNLLPRSVGAASNRLILVPTPLVASADVEDSIPTGTFIVATRDLNAEPRTVEPKSLKVSSAASLTAAKMSPLLMNESRRRLPQKLQLPSDGLSFSFGGFHFAGARSNRAVSDARPSSESDAVEKGVSCSHAKLVVPPSVPPLVTKLTSDDSGRLIASPPTAYGNAPKKRRLLGQKNRGGGVDEDEETDAEEKRQKVLERGRAAVHRYRLRKKNRFVELERRCAAQEVVIGDLRRENAALAKELARVEATLAKLRGEGVG